MGKVKSLLFDVQPMPRTIIKKKLTDLLDGMTTLEVKALEKAFEEDCKRRNELNEDDRDINEEHGER